MIKPKTVALCIPAYNAAEYLPRLLQSARNQITPFDEILIYNDCSTDKTEDVALDYGAKVIKGDTNRGCSFGKNKLAEITSCEWIHFHDADDELLPNFTMLARKWIDNPNCPDVVLFNYEYRDNETKELLHTRCFESSQLKKDPIDYAIREQINPFCGLYNRRRFLNAGGYDTDPDVLYNEDCAMHIKVAIAGLRFSSESCVSIINYRIKDSMSGNNKTRCIIAQFRVVQKTIKQLAELNLLYKYKDLLSAKAWKVAGILGSFGEWEYAKKAIQIATSLGSGYPNDTSKVFKLFCNMSPVAAFKLREKMIRAMKPHLRRNYA